MSTDLYSSVLFSDGEGITLTDLHAMQRNIHAMLTDQLLQSQVAGVAIAGITQPDFGGQNGTNVPTLWAYAISPGAAYLRQGSANNKIQIAPGTLLQKIANSDGQGSSLVPFWFDGSSAGEFTLTNGDATNPRVDLLQMKLAYISDTPTSRDFEDAVSRAKSTNLMTVTRRRVQCTLSVKAGTPAVSPVIPDPDAGFVPVSTVVVGNGWTTAGNAPIFGADTAATNNAVVHDQRMPLGVVIDRVAPSNFILTANWALSNNNATITSSSVTNTMYAISKVGPGRVIAVDVNSGGVTPIGTITLGSFMEGNAFSGANNGFVSGNTLTAAGFMISNVFRSMRSGFEEQHAPNGGAGPTILGSIALGIGVPMWTSGYRTPQPPTTGVAATSCVKIINQPNASQLASVSFYIAGGL